MHARHEYGDIVWIDLESPNALEVRQIAAEFDLAESVAEELISPTTKARSEFYSDYLYIVLQFPALKHSHKSAQQEVDFVIGRDFLITVRYDTIDQMHKFAKVFEAQAMLHTYQGGEHAGFLFYYILRKIYRGLDNELDYIRHELPLIEEHIFSAREVEMVAALSHTARGLLNLRQTIEPHREILRALEERGAVLFGEAFTSYLRELSSEYYRVHNHVVRATDSLHELRETNNSLLSTKQNETTKLFTIMAFFTFPLALLVEILAYKSPYNPISGRPFDFWIIVLLVLGGLFLMFLFFKHRKWL
ncbi:MAG TPA: CorA family divalent cation transporter [Candidatus Paceibacterota bacterium]